MRQPIRVSSGVFAVVAAGILGAVVAAAQQTPPARTAAGAVNAVDLPQADPAFKGVAERTLDGSKPDFPRPVTPPEGRTERPAGAGRRRRLRQPLDLRRPVPDAQPHEAGRAGPALQPISRDGALLAHEGRAPLRPEPSRHRLRLGRRVRRRMAGVQLDLAEGRRRRRQDPPGERLLHRRLRQVAPHARRPAGRGRAVRPLAQCARVRLFLGLPRRRERPVRHRRDREQHHRRRAQGQGLLLPDRHGRPHDPLDPRPEGPVPRQAVLHLLRPRRQPRPAPRPEGVGRPLQGEVRPGLGQAPRGDVRPAEGSSA